MRRRDFLHTDDAFFQEVATKAQVGYLGLVTAEGYPRSVAVNFVALGPAIYFHGALAGEKFELISGEAKVGFTMAWELSYIPSNWTGPEYACPATQLFKSVEIKGQCVVVEDLEEKARGLQALMVKHQPEGMFREIKADEKIYQKALIETGVFRVDADSWTGKMRMFEEKSEGFRKKLAQRLKERGLSIDDETIVELGRVAL